MEKMLRTWRQGGVGGVELFGQEVRETIEAGIFGRSVSNGMGLQGGYPTPIQYGGYPQQVQERVNTPPIAQSGFMGHQVNVEKQNVLKSLSRALHSKRTALSRNPGDAEAKVHVGVLEQVCCYPHGIMDFPDVQCHKKKIERLLATSNVNPQEIRDIQAQLDMIHNESSNQSGPLSGQITPIPQQFQTRPVDPYGDAPVETSRSQQQHLAPPRHPYSNGGGTPIPFEPGHSRSGSTPVIPHATVPAPAPATGKMDFGNLLRDLAFAGVIGSNSPTPGSTTPILGRARIREGSVTSNGSAAFGNGTGDENKADEEDGLQEYEQLILSMNVSLTLTDLSK
jgi:pre-mRNA cleavage complex 2 protein Pcf11